MQETSLIFTIALSLGLAFVFGLFAMKMRLSPIVGYLLAGILIGPHTPGVVANEHVASELSDLGIILLMFGIGLHFSITDLIAVRRVALMGALPQVILSTAAGTVLGTLWGWQWGTSLIFGLALSVASSVVVINELEKRNLIAHVKGKVSVAWLLTQDLAVVLFLVLLPALAPILQQPTVSYEQISTIMPSFVFAIARALIFIGFMLLLGRKLFPWVLATVAKTGSRELFTLFVVGVPISIALIAAQLFNVSFALGGFLAGIALNESELCHRAAANALPLQDAFVVLFFVSTGMSFDPNILSSRPWELLSAIVFALTVNSIISFALIVGGLRYKLGVAITVAAGVAQVGEFSLVLGKLGLKLALLPEPIYNIILGTALISIGLHSVTFGFIQYLGLRMRKAMQPHPSFSQTRPTLKA
jgi:monovalent cation:H+ antiporter-2, CPA2 family